MRPTTSKNGAQLREGKMQFLALKELEPHPLAQRKFDPKHATDMANTFDPAKLGTITVAETTKGKRWVVDGQHRRAAAIQWLGGDLTQAVECRVIPVENDAEAAELFLGLNNHKAVSTLDKFIVRCVAKDELALGVAAVLAKHGLRVDRSRAPGVVQAVDACESLYVRQNGPQLLDRVLRVIRQTWGDDPDAYYAQLIKGIGHLFIKHPSANDEELAKKLAKRGGPLSLIGLARDLKQAMGLSMAEAVYERIKNEYNRGRRTEKLEDQAA